VPSKKHTKAIVKLRKFLAGAQTAASCSSSEDKNTQQMQQQQPKQKATNTIQTALEQLFKDAITKLIVEPNAFLSRYAEQLANVHASVLENRSKKV